MRIINLIDPYGNTLVRTNVPEDIIQEALNYRDECILNGDELPPEFEMIQEYIYEKNNNYVFEMIGDLEDIESYNW